MSLPGCRSYFTHLSIYNAIPTKGGITGQGQLFAPEQNAPKSPHLPMEKVSHRLDYDVGRVLAYSNIESGMNARLGIKILPLAEKSHISYSHA
jgi:hypothetical protein